MKTSRYFSTCVYCENTYSPKNKYCRRCDYEAAKNELLNELVQSEVGEMVGKMLDWLAKIFKRK